MSLSGDNIEQIPLYSYIELVTFHCELWLLTGEEETRAKFQYGEEPPAEQYENDFGSFKT